MALVSFLAKPDSEKTFSSDKGGCIATDDGELAEKVRFLSTGRAGVDVPHFGRTHTAFGHAYDMSKMTAALCLAQLETIRDQVDKIDGKSNQSDLGTKILDDACVTRFRRMLGLIPPYGSPGHSAKVNVLMYLLVQAMPCGAQGADTGVVTEDHAFVPTFSFTLMDVMRMLFTGMLAVASG